MTEMITEFLNNAQSTVSPVVPVIGVLLIIRGLIRLSHGNEAAKGGAGGGKLVIIGSCLTCYKILSSVIISTLQNCGLEVGNIIKVSW
ncbi:MAG: hypothetical protein H6Q52_3327 [Deltaproteobacteria bacterium]|nr:hypothetical protein [Deltaproteobacteria bacterium]